MTVALGYGRLRIFIHVFVVGKKAISIGTNRIPGDFANPRTGSSSVPQTNCKMWHNSPPCRDFSYVPDEGIIHFFLMLSRI